MNILFLFCHLAPLDSDNDLFVQLINEFKAQGHQVCVSTKGIGKAKTQVAIENGVEVLRIKSHDFTGVSSNVKKALAYQEYVVKQRHYTKKYFGKKMIDLIITHSLPPEVAWVVSGLKRHFGCPVYLIQSDYTWQDAVAFGYFSDKSPIALYYKFWENKMMNQADYIGCPTTGNFGFIKKYHPQVNDDKFDLLPFWLNELNVEPNYELKKELGLEGRFTVIYGGSVGAAQRIEHIVELAEACQEQDDIAFVILGRGTYLEVIKGLVEEKGLKNVVFQSFLPQDQYLRFLAACDVGLIILNEQMGTPNFPSKSLSYLNMRVPILAALDHITDFGSYLEEHKAGLWAYSDDVTALQEKLMAYYKSENLRQGVRSNGYRLFKEQLTTEQAYRTIMNKVTKL